MAHGDSRPGTWQVLLTISMVITPLTAHGESDPPPHKKRALQCVQACARLFARARVLIAFSPPSVHECYHTCVEMRQLLVDSSSGGGDNRLSCVIRPAIWLLSFLSFLLPPSPSIVTTSRPIGSRWIAWAPTNVLPFDVMAQSFRRFNFKRTKSLHVFGPPSVAPSVPLLNHTLQSQSTNPHPNPVHF